MSQRRRALTLEPVEDRCVPSGVRLDYRPPPAAFADYGQYAGPSDEQRIGHQDDGPLNRGPGTGSEFVVVVIPRTPDLEPAAPRVSFSKLTDLAAAARAGSYEFPEVRFARPDAITESALTAAFAAGRIPLRLQTSVSEAPPPVAEPVVASQFAPRPPGAMRTLAVTTTVPDQAMPANQVQPVATTPTVNFALPGIDSGRTALATVPTWVAVAEPATEVPTPATPTPDAILPPVVAAEPPTVAAVVDAAREAVVAAAVPLVGALPVDLVAVERAAADLLAGLTEAAAPESSVGQWGWVGLSVLAAGGLIHALRPATDRRHTAAVGNDSALARWESRHARRPR